MDKKSSTFMRSLVIAVVVIVVAVIIFSSYAVVAPGNRGVVVMLGRVENTVLGEGFHLILPPVARQVIQVDVRTKKLEVNTEAASADLQTMLVNGVLNYHPEPISVGMLYQEVGLDYESIIIVPAMQEAIKSATAQYKIENVLIERAMLKQSIQDLLVERLRKGHIVVDEFSLANVEFSAEFNAAIERKQVAEQSALQKQYELQAAQKDVEIQLAKAEGEKKAQIIAADGRAEARKLEAAAEAQALELIAEQLKDSPALIQYEWASRLSPSVKTVLMPSDQAIMLNADSIVNP